MKEKILQILSGRKGSCVSGQEISEKLGVSRTAVWKHIKNMQQQGYPIRSTSGKGYLIEAGHSFLIPEEIKNNLRTQRIGKQITVFTTVDSTNNWARKFCDQLEHGSVIVSEEQTEGKGRRGKAWTSPKGEGLWFTLFLKPAFSVERAGFTTQLAAAAMWHAIHKMTGIRPEIKWPNDLLVDGRKICGILTELSGELNQIDFLMVGVGVNVNQEEFPPGLTDIASSIRRELGKPVDRTMLLAEFLNRFESFYNEFENHLSCADAMEIIRAHSSVINQPIDILKGQDQRAAIGRRILDNGNLEVQYENGEREILSGGEVSVRNQ